MERTNWYEIYTKTNYYLHLINPVIFFRFEIIKITHTLNYNDVIMFIESQV